MAMGDCCSVSCSVMSLGEPCKKNKDKTNQHSPTDLLPIINTFLLKSAFFTGTVGVPEEEVLVEDDATADVLDDGASLEDTLELAVEREATLVILY